MSMLFLLMMATAPFSVVSFQTGVTHSDSTNAAAIYAHYQDQTRADIRCRTASETHEIVVCGARSADRYRVPFITYDAGDPRYEGVWTEAERLQGETTPCREHSTFLVGCGMAGVHASARFGPGGITGTRLRPLAE